MSVDPEEFQKFIEELNKKFTPEVLEKLKKLPPLPKHTGFTIIVGGVRSSCPRDPNYWRGPRKVWCCPKNCPACKRDKERERKYGRT